MWSFLLNHNRDAASQYVHSPYICPHSLSRVNRPSLYPPLVLMREMCFITPSPLFISHSLLVLLWCFLFSWHPRRKGVEFILLVLIARETWGQAQGHRETGSNQNPGLFFSSAGLALEPLCISTSSLRDWGGYGATADFSRLNSLFIKVGFISERVKVQQWLSQPFQQDVAFPE